MANKIISNILEGKSKGKKQLAVLVDPDKVDKKKCEIFCQLAAQAKPDVVLVGGSVITTGDLEETVNTIKENLVIPVILFPGNSMHIASHADGILFLSLVSGRNPEYLIGQQVAAAPRLKKTDIEVIPTGYILIDGGVTTTVHYISNTQPIPHGNTALAMATSLASEMLGQQLVYLDCGSGAKNPVSSDMVKLVSDHLSVPLLVGGGIKTKAQAETAYASGADMLVIGTAIEDKLGLMQEMCEVRDQFNA